MENERKVFCDLENRLRSDFKSLEDSSSDAVHEFIDKCKDLLQKLRAQGKVKAQIGFRNYIESSIRRVEGMKILALVRLSERKKQKNSEPLVLREIESIFRSRVRTGLIVNNKYLDPILFFDGAKDLVKGYVNNAIHEFHTIKVCAVLTAVYTLRETEDEKVFSNKYISLCESSDLDEWFETSVKQEILAGIDDFETQKDSGWTLVEINNLAIQINKYNPMRAGTYVKLPAWINRKQALLNIDTGCDNDCFAVCVMAALYPAKTNPTKAVSYPDWADYLNFSGIDFPVAIKDVPKFESQNHVSVNVFILEEKKVLPVHLTNNEQEKHINLFLYTQTVVGEVVNSHYCLIKDLSRLVSQQCSKRKCAKHICNRCLHYFPSAERLSSHREVCKMMNETAIILPEEGKNILVFKNFERKLQVPFIVYADTECFLGKVESPTAPLTSYQEHQVYSIGYYLHCNFNQSLSGYYSARQPNCAAWFAKQLHDLADKVQEILVSVQPMNLTLEDKEKFKSSELCHICERPFEQTDLKVRDHCHMTGVFRGAAHSNCNLNYKYNFKIPVVFHNLTSYDAHFIIREIASLIPGRTKVIPSTMEKYICFMHFVKHTKILFNFIDSFKFMSASLEKLATYLGNDKKIILRSAFLDENDFQLVTAKGIFPYDYIYCTDKLEEETLPVKEKFHNILNQTDVSSEDYERAIGVFKHFKCKSIGEYSDLYLKTDVLLLADIFENFRHAMSSTHGLDPAHYITLPSYSWDCALKLSRIELELLTDIDIVMFLERGIRGGLCHCANRYAKANNKYMKNYDESQDSRYLQYFDVNNLYGYGMSEFLPTHGFKWVENCANFDFRDVPDDSTTGYVLEVSISYPDHIHDLQKDLPMCAESAVPPGGKHQKLLATLLPKFHYVIHYRNLKQAVKHGVKLHEIHRVLEFQQSPWLKSYIDLNTTLRKIASNDFEKSLFKFLNNSIFGKSLESTRKHRDVHLKTEWDGRYGVEAMISKPNFTRRLVFDDSLIAIELKKLSVTLDKPIYVGFSILEISKTVLYNFHYEYVLPNFGNSAKLLYTDTDSLIYEFQVDDIYERMKENLDKFDTSDYPDGNPYSMPKVNKKVPGLMKDETNGELIEEFIGLRAKMYAVKLCNDNVIKRAKGIKSSVVSKKIDIEDYKRCLFESKTISREQRLIRSKLHNVYSICEKKLALSPFDDKRYLIPNSTDTLPWGHKDIMEQE